MERCGVRIPWNSRPSPYLYSRRCPLKFLTDLVLPGGHVSKNWAKEIGSGIAWASGELDVSASFGSSDIRKKEQ